MKLAFPALLLILSLLTPLAGVAQKFAALKQQTFFGTELDDQPKRLIAGPDSTFFVAGVVKDKFGSTDGWLAQIDKKGNKIWSKTFGGAGFDEIRDIVRTKSGNEIYFCGVTGTNLPHNESSDLRFHADFWVGKISIKGDIIWEQTYGGSNHDQAYSLALTKYDGCVVVGSSWSQDGDASNNNGDLNNGWVLVLNPDGKVIRNTSYSGNKNDWAQTIATMPDGGFAMAGFTNSNDKDKTVNPVKGDVFISRMDFTGNTLWTLIVPELYENRINRIISTKYGYIIAVGRCFTPEKGMQFWFLKIDDSGKIIGDYKFGGTGYEELTSVQVTKDEGFILSGYSFYNTIGENQVKGARDFWLIRTDADGNIIWQKTFGGPDYEVGVDVIEYSPNVYFALGLKHNNFGTNDKGADFWLIRVEEFPCATLEAKFVTDIQETRERANIPIRFSNQSTMGDYFLWDFGDGTTSTERSPRKAYKKPGIYMVKMTAFINENCKKTYIYPKPVIITD